VKPDAWEPAVKAMADAAVDGRVADGLIAAVEKAAAALRAAGVVGKGGGELSTDAVDGEER
jgi:uncharacterized membrane protein